MTTPRPHASSAELLQQTIEDMDKQSTIMQMLLPNIPKFTVVVSAAFPHDEVDMDLDREDPENAPPILESYTLFVRAVNVHTAIDSAMTKVALMIREDEGDQDFTLSVSAAFEGHIADLSPDYDYTKSGLYDAENAIKEYEESQLDTHIS